MTLNEYQERAAATRVYPNTGATAGLVYVTLGLAGESGELANTVKKILRGDYPTQAVIQTLRKEVGDAMWYCAMLADELGTTLEEIASENLEKLASRAQRGVVRGSGDNR